MKVAIVAVAFGIFTVQQEDPGKIKWTRDYEAGLKTAAEKGMPVLLYFGWKT